MLASINRIRKLFIVTLLITSGFVMQSCFTVNYSLSGASIHPDAKTVSVQYFLNNAPLINPQLSQELTETLKDKFSSQTSLKLVNGIGDMDFTGEITGYATKPMAIQDNDVAALNRLTISIRVKYVNSKDPESKFDFDKVFSRYEDYESKYDLSQVEGELATKIVDMLVEDIFNESVVNW